MENGILLWGRETQMLKKCELMERALFSGHLTSSSLRIYFITTLTDGCFAEFHNASRFLNPTSPQFLLTDNHTSVV